MANVLGDAYILGDLLGHGGMGKVYAAEQTSLQRPVAVKLMHPQLAVSPRIVERFRTEAIAGSRLSHPNVAGVVDFGTTSEGIPFLVMERIPGETLGVLVEREGALPVRRACGLILQILSGLGEAHAAGVIHADVKSDNVLVDNAADGEEVATVIDFGIARLLDRADHTQADDCDRMLSGTPEYLAPEIVRGDAPTQLSDLYSIGVVLYELVTGHTPFAGGSAVEILERHVSDAIIAPSLRRPDLTISPAIDCIVMRALAKDPAARFPSAASFAHALRQAMPTNDLHRKPPQEASGFSTETPTQEWSVEELPPSLAGRCRTSPDTRPLDRGEQLRKAIGESMASGSVNEIANRYLALARHLVDVRRLEAAVVELDQAISIVTMGEGADAAHPPDALWPVLLAQAALFDGIGDPVKARRTTLAAETAARRASSDIGRDRAQALYRRLVRGT